MNITIVWYTYIRQHSKCKSKHRSLVIYNVGSMTGWTNRSGITNKSKYRQSTSK